MFESRSFSRKAKLSLSFVFVASRIIKHNLNIIVYLTYLQEYFKPVAHRAASAEVSDEEGVLVVRLPPSSVFLVFPAWLFHLYTLVYYGTSGIYLVVSTKINNH